MNNSFRSVDTHPYCHPSEARFAAYLDSAKLIYHREVPVKPGVIDFVVTSNNADAYCDVKAVESGFHDVADPVRSSCLDAHEYIREDLRKLRQKFDVPPKHSCVLVTMNYSKKLMSAMSISTAMIGDIGQYLDVSSELTRASPVQHLFKGNAALQSRKNTSISGILVMDHHGDHCYFPNPHAAIPLPKGFFPNAREIMVQQDDTDEALIREMDTLFYPGT